MPGWLGHTNSQMALWLLHSVLDPRPGSCGTFIVPSSTVTQTGQMYFSAWTALWWVTHNCGFTAYLLVPELFLQSLGMRSR